MVHQQRLAEARACAARLPCALLATVLCGCAMAPEPETVQALSPLATQLAAARALEHERAFRRALDAFQSAARLDPDSPEPRAGRGSALFRMDRYKAAFQAFGQALDRNPGHHRARHRSWAARLEAAGNEPAVQRDVASAIEASLAQYPRHPGAWLAAFHGYAYLHRREDMLRVLAGLCERARGTEFAAPAALLLREEILQERDPGRRIRLAEIFLDTLPSLPGVGVAVDALLFTLAGETTGSGSLATRLLALAETGSGSAEFNRVVALWLVREGLDMGNARRLLEANLRQGAAARTPGGKPGVAYRARREIATDRYLLARVHHRAGRLEAARRLLLTAARDYPEGGRILLLLGQIAEHRGERVAALGWYRRALAAASELEQARAGLQRLQGGDAAMAPGAVRFDDVTLEAGLARVRARRVAWGDYDGDGRVDLLLDGRLFRNARGMGFEEVTASVGLPGAGPVNGGIWGDIDNDGWLDLLLTSHGVNRLYRNLAGLRFQDVSRRALPDPDLAEPTEAAAWGDLDNDGWLDLYLANYERAGVERGLCVHDRLYRNRGNGVYVDVTRHAGIVSVEAMCGRGVLWRDLNGDALQDVFVSNYRLDPNFLWLNRAAGRFQDRAGAAGARGSNARGHYGHSIGAAAGDLDNDGDIDLFVSNLAHPRYLETSDLSMLLMNHGTGTPMFRDRFADSGIFFEETSANPALADLDNDGDLDLYFSAVYPGRSSHLYLNDGRGHFEDVTWISGTRMTNGWGAAFADYDGDGDLDLLAAGPEGVRLFRNRGSTNGWLRVAVRSRNCNRYGIGATVRIRHGGREQVRELAAGSGTGVQAPAAAHFGLGSHEGPVQVRVRTLCGDEAVNDAVRPNQAVVVDVG